MILDVLCYRNKKIKCYANPVYSNTKPEHLKTSVIRQILGGQLEEHRHLALYNLGTFDDELGKFDLKSEPELLFDCDDLIDTLGLNGK